MEWILLDWTRMGPTWCLAGVVHQGGQYRVVRPLSVRQRHAPVRNVGWSPFLYHPCRRWEVFDLVNPEPAPPRPPHLEDVWVRDLRPRGVLVDAVVRRTILEATRTPPGAPPFGSPWRKGQTAAWLPMHAGVRSLATVLMPSAGVSIRAVPRSGKADGFRAVLPLPDLAGMSVPIKDHWLLERAAQVTADPRAQADLMTRVIASMGEQVAVRLGLSRPHPADEEVEPVCWLMVDGFFSANDPQP